MCRVRRTGILIAGVCAWAAALLTITGGAGGRADELEAILSAQRNVNAVQSIYLSGVPHTDRRGRMLNAYDPERSFFSIGVWGVPPPTEWMGHTYDWRVLKDAGINTVWPWYRLEEVLEACEEYDMQAVVMGGISEEHLHHPAVLANVWMDEPPLWPGAESEALLQEFLEYQGRIRQLAPDLPVFVNLVPWIMPPAASWWGKWNEAGDISCHDNYPIMHRIGAPRPRSVSADPNGIAQTVSFAIANTREQKPLWLIVGAFTDTQSPAAAFPFRFPSPEQLRACVYAAIIHGATGITYFTWDTWIPRDGGVIGMSRDPQVAYVPIPRQEGLTNPSPATPMQLAQARACWEAATQINHELAELTPVILAPTVSSAELSYTVSVHGSAPIATPLSCLLKPHPEGGYALLTVNAGDTALRVDYEFPAPLAQVATMFDNRTPESGVFPGPLQFEPGAGSFSLTYDPFETHVLRLLLAEQ